MTTQTVDPVALHLTLRRIAQREAAARDQRRRAGPGLWRRFFARGRARREHIARLSPSETVHSNLPT